MAEMKDWQMHLSVMEMHGFIREQSTRGRKKVKIAEDALHKYLLVAVRQVCNSATPNIEV